ncbi:hypothetical protein ACIA8G_12205 [Lentzea sp. NPDC051213]|uniref:hypothetical protein n=1 Tax=Lentzea sp. NPDC051213 TaxID=3364126 RepID=UPI0037A883E2
MISLSSTLENWRDEAERVLDELQKAPGKGGSYKDKFREWNKTAIRVHRSSEKLSSLMHARRREFSKRNIAIKTKLATIATWEMAATNLITVLTGITEQHAGSKTPTRTADQMKREARAATELLFAVRHSMLEAIESIEELIVEVRSKSESAASIPRLEVRVDTHRFRPSDETLPDLNDAS